MKKKQTVKVARFVAPDDNAGIIRGCRELHTAIDRLDAAVADSIGVSRNDLRCLNLLENGPLSSKAIGTALGLTSGSMTALIDRLEKKGLVRRIADPLDRRGVMVEATETVFREIGHIYRDYAQNLLAITATYSDREKREAAAHLNDAAKACLLTLSRAAKA
jgi:DNA-binding MarR family transcriptional regulator